METHLTSAYIALVLSIPFWGIAALISVIGTRGTDVWTKAFAAILSHKIYFLGAPLTVLYWTSLVTLNKTIKDKDLWWYLPSLSLVFVFQWLIWSQIIAVITNSVLSIV